MLNLSKFKTSILSAVQDDQVLFRLSIAMKFLILPVITLIIAFGFFYSFLRMDLYFFEAHKVSSITNFQETYYDYILSAVAGEAHVVVLLLAGTLLLGLYMANMVLRPFRTLGSYCEDVVEGRKASYDQEFFSELRLLTRFSDYFFGVIAVMTKNGKLGQVDVPEKFTRIHQPVFEKAFFLQFSLFILMTSIATGTAVFKVTVDIHGQILSLADKTVALTPAIKYFLEKQ